MVTSSLKGTGSLREYLAAIVEWSDDAILGVDPRGIIISWNPGAERLFGYSASEILGRDVRTLIPALSRGRETTTLEKSGTEEHTRLLETLRQRKDGTAVKVSLTVSPIKDSTGKVVGASHIARDVGEGTLLEGAVLAKEKVLVELRASETRYRRLFEAAKDGVLLLNADTGLIEDVNPFMMELMAMPREEFLGKPLWALGLMKDAMSNLAAFQELKSKGYIRYEHLPLKSKLGNEVHVEFVSNVYIAGDVKVIQCNVRDITVRYHAEQALKKAEEQLRHSQKMDAFGQLAAGVAHDFNNLLTVINGYSELVMGALPPESPFQGDLGEILKAGQHAGLLTRQLLAFSRKQLLEPRVLDLNGVVMKMNNLLKRVIGEDVRLADSLSPDLWRVKVDPGQMEQVILNLAVNSRDAMRKGGTFTIETANVELDGKLEGLHPPVRSGPYVVLSVSDTGSGMDEAVMAHLFEPFFTTKGPGKGTGLGLATVFGIVRQSGGSIGVRSVPGKGSTFKIYLPRAGEALDEVPCVKTGSDVPTGVETILLVEDEASVRKLGLHILETYGYTVLQASSGPEAIELSGRHSGRIHLLLSDMVMPGMSGTDLSLHLSALRPDMKTLLVSGYTKEAVARHGHDKPGPSFLPKPYTPGDLARKIRAVLDE